MLGMNRRTANSLLQSGNNCGIIRPRKELALCRIPIRDLKNTAAISQLCSESTEPVYITKNGYGNMVIMSMEAYEEKMYMLDVYSKLAEAEDKLREGKTLDARTSLKELRAKHGILG